MQVREDPGRPRRRRRRSRKREQGRQKREQGKQTRQRRSQARIYTDKSFLFSLFYGNFEYIQIVECKVMHVIQSNISGKDCCVTGPWKAASETPRCQALPQICSFQGRPPFFVVVFRVGVVFCSFHGGRCFLQF